MYYKNTEGVKHRMNYQYRPGGYGYRKKKKVSGGTIAAIFAMILVFAAGFLIGNAGKLSLFSPAETSSESTPTSAPENGSSAASSDISGTKLPDGLEYAEPVSDASPVSIGGLDSVTAGSYLVIDRLTGAVLLEKDSNVRIYPGETTQIMTAALALEKGSGTDSVTVTSFALGLVGNSSKRIGLLAGETLTMQDALSAVVAGGAADAANAIAESFGYNQFVRDMVVRASELGCTGTYFVSPNGAYSDAHFSTVHDLVRMTAYAEKNEPYRAMASANSVVLSANNVHTADGWCVVSDGSLLNGLQTLLSGSSNIARITDTQSGMTTKGYTLVCSAVTAKGVQITAAIGNLPYDSGRGASRCLTEMAALLEAGAAAADNARQTVCVPAGEPLDASLSDGVSDVLPLGASLIPETGLILTQTDTMLENGTVALFDDPSGYTVSIKYDSDLQEQLDYYRRGSTAEIGYLTVLDRNGTEVCEPIAVWLK